MITAISRSGLYQMVDYFGGKCVNNFYILISCDSRLGMLVLTCNFK